MSVGTSTGDPARAGQAPACGRAVRLGYLVSHPIQYQAPLLRALAREPGIDLRVIYLSDFSSVAYRDPEFGVAVAWDVPLLDGYAHRFLGHRMPGRLRPLAPRLEAVLAEECLDVVWLHGYAHHTALRAIRFAHRRGIKVLLRGESSAADSRPGWKRTLLRQIFARADGVLAIGARNRRFYLQHGVPVERIFDVPYAVDNERFAHDGAAARCHSEELRTALSLDPDRPVVLFAAKLIERKRPMDVVAAIARIAAGADGPRPYLLLVGDGALRSSIERAADPDVVRVLGFRNQSAMPALYGLADVFVLPSAYETYGLAVNEAMCAGCPVIVSEAVGAGEDLVINGVNGYVYPTGDVGALEDRLRRLLQRPGLRALMGRESARLMHRHTIAAAATGVAAAVRQVVRS